MSKVILCGSDGSDVVSTAPRHLLDGGGCMKLERRGLGSPISLFSSAMLVA